ncbi:hypothetical protein GIB67_030726 [Kingdonia uniflora]|uniref:Uncharacterized protein n=1 Tax=Kingdonia uniflora TaxID=39325 RepID=A0A7J7L318_9MAGN|nr:hypothetical protein GIB67_030726 [Kingdonia uniflora]
MHMGPQCGRELLWLSLVSLINVRGWWEMAEILIFGETVGALKHLSKILCPFSKIGRTLKIFYLR